MTKTVVICGGGIMGCSVAYYLSKHKENELKIVIVERTSVACSASGKAGGFLARNWSDSLPTKNLTRRSFELHKQLSIDLNGSDTYGYREVDTHSVVADLDSTVSTTFDTNQWLKKNFKCSFMAGNGSTAQVNPLDLTKKLLDESLLGGANLVIGTVTDLLFDESGGVRAVCVDGKPMECDAVVVAMGAWSYEINKYTKGKGPKIPITGAKAHSIVYAPKNQPYNQSPQVFFVDYTMNGINKDMEIYPKSGGELYICGESQDEKIPKSADLINIDSSCCQRLIETSKILIKDLEVNYELKRQQACYLPVTDFNTPLIGQYPEIKNMFLACGHGCWGILNAPATGMAIAELLVLGKTTVDIKNCDPKILLNKGH